MTHKHHIIPKHIGGSDDPSNLIEVSISEHAEIHKKMYEEHGRWQDYVAWKGLTGCINKEEIIREISSINGKKRKGCKREDVSLKNKKTNLENNPAKNPEIKKKLSLSKTGSNNHFYGIKGPSHPRYGKPGASTGKRWYHNNINNNELYCFENQQPQGYILGRLKKIKKG